jgi:hypothetical protein
MTDSQDIRTWAKTQGIDIGVRGRIPDTVREQYDASRNGGGELPELDAAELILPGEPEVPQDAPPPKLASVGTVVPERPPERPKRRGGLLGRKPREAKPKSGHKRVSLENLISSGWGLAALALARSPQALPVARILDLQAPVAGIIVDDMARGTIADKILQPLARMGEKGEKLFALAGPPMLVGMMTAQPQLFPVLKPMLKMSMMSWMQVSKPAMEKVQKRAEAFAEDFGDMDLDAMIDALWIDAPVPSEQEEANIRKARGE